MTKTPIAYIIFNRPSITKQSFEVLKEQKPLELFIIADGPRLGYPNDKKVSFVSNGKKFSHRKNAKGIDALV